MTVFYNKDKNAVLVTSFKVMYWTLKHQKSLSLEAPKNFIVLNILSATPLYHREHCLLVRNPYTRIESFFKDKFRKNILRHKEGDPWQHCQKIFFNSLEINEKMDFEVIKLKFLNTSFDKFIEILPSVYTSDRHLCPQFQNAQIAINKWGVRLKYRIRFDKIFKMESVEDLKEMSNKFDLDLKERMNSTDEVVEKIIWSERDKRVIKEIYGTDFKEFKYDLKVKRPGGQHQGYRAYTYKCVVNRII